MHQTMLKDDSSNMPVDCCIEPNHHPAANDHQEQTNVSTFGFLAYISCATSLSRKTLLNHHGMSLQACNCMESFAEFHSLLNFFNSIACISWDELMIPSNLSHPTGHLDGSSPPSLQSLHQQTNHGNNNPAVTTALSKLRLPPQGGMSNKESLLTD